MTAVSLDACKKGGWEYFQHYAVLGHGGWEGVSSEGGVVKQLLALYIAWTLRVGGVSSEGGVV